VFVLAVLQFVRPAIPAKPATAEIQAPPDVKQILDKDCTAATQTNGGSPGSTRSCPATGWYAMTS
jgi:hypothetical protein